MTLCTRANLGLFCNKKAISNKAMLFYLLWQSCKLIVLQAHFFLTLHISYLAFAAINTQSDQLCSKGLELVTVIIV